MKISSEVRLGSSGGRVWGLRDRVEDSSSARVGRGRVVGSGVRRRWRWWVGGGTGLVVGAREERGSKGLCFLWEGEVGWRSWSSWIPGSWDSRLREGRRDVAREKGALPRSGSGVA